MEITLCKDCMHASNSRYMCAGTAVRYCERFCSKVRPDGFCHDGRKSIIDEDNYYKVFIMQAEYNSTHKTMEGNL